MKLPSTSLFAYLIVIMALLASPVERAFGTATPNQSGDPGWPREKYSNGTRLIIYQPQVDDWKNFQELAWRMAISLTPKSGKEVVGVVERKYGHRQRCQGRHHYESAGYGNLLSFIGQSRCGKDGAIV